MENKQLCLSYGFLLTLDNDVNCEDHCKRVSSIDLEGYKLQFYNGLATIVPDKEHEVKAVLFEISEDLEAYLDEFEGVDDNFYEKVYVDLGPYRNVLIYMMNEKYVKPENKYLPLPSTLDRMFEGYIRNGFDTNILKRLIISEY